MGRMSSAVFHAEMLVGKTDEATGEFENPNQVRRKIVGMCSIPDF